MIGVNGLGLGELYSVLLKPKAGDRLLGQDQTLESIPCLDFLFVFVLKGETTLKTGKHVDLVLVCVRGQLSLS